VLIGSKQGAFNVAVRKKEIPIRRLPRDLFNQGKTSQRPLGRIQIEPRDVSQLVVELRIGAELEALDPMGLQPVLLPNAMQTLTILGDHANYSESAFPRNRLLT